MIVTCEDCGYEEEYRENSIQICRECDHIVHLTRKDMPKPVLNNFRSMVEEQMKKIEG